MRQWMMTGLVVAALAGCSVFQANPESDATKKAAAAGRMAGRSVCQVAVLEAPDSRPAITEALDRTRAVLAAPDFTLAALDEAMNALPNPKARLYGSLLFGNLMDALALANVDVQRVEPGSPVVVGIDSAVAACAAAVGGVA